MLYAICLHKLLKLLTRDVPLSVTTFYGKPCVVKSDRSTWMVLVEVIDNMM